MTSYSSKETLERIHAALEAAREVLNRFTPGAIAAEYKAGHDPVTEADRAIDAVLRENLLRDGEGWLSEESVDDFTRLDKQRVWVVDPLDGTREFVQGIPEFCVSIAMVENGVPVAGGVCNPATDAMLTMLAPRPLRSHSASIFGSACLIGYCDAIDFRHHIAGHQTRLTQRRRVGIIGQLIPFELPILHHRLDGIHAGHLGRVGFKAVAGLPKPGSRRGGATRIVVLGG